MRSVDKDKQRNRRIAAHVTQSEYESFLALCEKEGVSLSTGLRILLMQAIEQQETMAFSTGSRGLRSAAGSSQLNVVSALDGPA